MPGAGRGVRGAGKRRAGLRLTVACAVCLGMPWGAAGGGEGGLGRQPPPAWGYTTPPRGAGPGQPVIGCGLAGGVASAAVGLGEGGGTVDWQAEARLLREEKIALEEQVQRLRDENKALIDVRSGQQSTLDPFLFRRRQPGDAATASDAHGGGEADALLLEQPLGAPEDGEGASAQEGGRAGGFVDHDTVKNVVSLNTKNAKRKHPPAPSAAAGAFHRPLTAAQAQAVAAAALQAVDRELAAPPGEQAAPASPVKKRSLGNANILEAFSANTAASSSVIQKAVGARAQASAPGGATAGGGAARGVRAEEDEVVVGASASVPFAKDMAKALAARRARISVAGEDHYWEGILEVAPEGGTVEIGVREGARLLGAWKLDGGGGCFRGGALCHEHGSCVAVDGGEWAFSDCSVLSSGVAAVQDAQQHNSINTALYCAGLSRSALARTAVGGLERGKEAFWGVFAASESVANLTNCSVQHCLDSGCAAVGSSAIRLEGSELEQCVVAVTGDAESTVSVHGCVFRSNGAAFECGYAGVSTVEMSLRDNHVFGQAWKGDQRPLRLEESGTVLGKGDGVRRGSHISIETKSAAALHGSDETGLDADCPDEDEEGLEAAGQRGVRRARHKMAREEPAFANSNARIAHAALSFAP